LIKKKSWTDRWRKEGVVLVLHRIKEDRNILHTHTRERTTTCAL